MANKYYPFAVIKSMPYPSQISWVKYNTSLKLNKLYKILSYQETNDIWNGYSIKISLFDSSVPGDSVDLNLGKHDFDKHIILLENTPMVHLLYGN